MGETSKIQWTDATWNPWYGCTHVSPGCDQCYMFAGMRRYGRDPETVHRAKPATFNAPLKWPARRIFTCSWSDFFISDADQWRDDAWDIIRRTPQSTYQILTKRPVLVSRRLPKDWDSGWPNVWLGVSVESRAYLSRIDDLRRVPARVRFVSFEPLIEYLGDVDLTGISWSIIGGESGAQARPCDIRGIYNLVKQSRAQGAKPFVKQLGARPFGGHVCTCTVGACHAASLGVDWFCELGKRPGWLRHPKGGEITEFPEYLAVREYPDA